MKVGFRVGLEFSALFFLGSALAIPVSAQRRSESLLSVPLSITAATGDQLTNMGIQDITDLELITPGMNVSDSSGYTQVYRPQRSR
jgi:iron complex outermembrane recepter protein